jgi:Na+/H+-translocating membrane pyrophosphatase
MSDTLFFAVGVLMGVVLAHIHLQRHLSRSAEAVDNAKKLVAEAKVVGDNLEQLCRDQALLIGQLKADLEARNRCN